MIPMAMRNQDQVRIGSIQVLRCKGIRQPGVYVDDISLILKNCLNEE